MPAGRLQEDLGIVDALARPLLDSPLHAAAVALGLQGLELLRLFRRKPGDLSTPQQPYPKTNPQPSELRGQLQTPVRRDTALLVCCLNGPSSTS